MNVSVAQTKAARRKLIKRYPTKKPSDALKPTGKKAK